jgi:two-component system CheB/CheR fusion protein
MSTSKPPGFADASGMRFDGPPSRAAALAPAGFAAAGIGAWQSDLDSMTGEGDDLVMQLLGLDPLTRPWRLEDVRARIHPEDLGDVDAAMENSVAGRAPFTVEFRLVSNSAPHIRWIGARGAVIERRADGTARRMAGVNWDATLDVQRRQSSEVMQRELDHRVRNAFAVVNALVGIGARRTSDVRTFARNLSGQIGALAQAHEVSTRLASIGAERRLTVPATEILADVLAPWTSAIEIDADPSVALESRAAAALAMLVHELATNAVKYGPLGEAGGTISLSLSPRGDAGGFEMLWEERRDGPAPPAASGTGYGSVLMTHCLGVLRAELDRDLRPEGLRLRLVAAG